MAAFDVNGGVSCRAKSQRDKDFNAGYEQGFIQGVKQASESLANCHQSEIDALEVLVEELKVDAERWQWLKQNNARIIECGVYDWKFISTDTNAIKQKVYRRTGWTVSTLPIGDEYETMDEAVDQAIQQQKGEE